MNDLSRAHCASAQFAIRNGHYLSAVQHLRAALRQTIDRRAWSKLMLAIRELNRVIN